MLYAVGTHISFKKNIEAEPEKESRLVEPGTRFVFIDYLEDAETVKVSPYIFLQRLHAM